MNVVPGSSDGDVVHTGTFGRVPKSLIGTIEQQSLHDLSQSIFREAIDGRKSKDEVVAMIDEFRTGVGALWIKMRDLLNADIEQAHRTTSSLWYCLWSSLVTRRLNAQKYRSICGTATGGYGMLVTCLANMPHQDELAKRWDIKSWRQYGDSIWRTKNQLMEKEREFRDLAIAIAQIGVGVGGMLIGLFGLALAILLPLIAQFLNV
jgi:hypothetical protein